MKHGKRTLKLACRGLARLVRDEYPEGYSLVQIAEIWGDLTDAEVEAIRCFEEAEAND